eukprot:10299386-Karenia_brevis.AAC.1
MARFVGRADDVNAIKIRLVGVLREEEILKTPSQAFDVLVESEEEMIPEEWKEQVNSEREILEEIPFPGAPLSEQERGK